MCKLVRLVQSSGVHEVCASWVGVQADGVQVGWWGELGQCLPQRTPLPAHAALSSPLLLAYARSIAPHRELPVAGPRQSVVTPKAKVGAGLRCPWSPAPCLGCLALAVSHWLHHGHYGPLCRYRAHGQPPGCAGMEVPVAVCWAQVGKVCALPFVPRCQRAQRAGDEAHLDVRAGTGAHHHGTDR